MTDELELSPPGFTNLDPDVQRIIEIVGRGLVDTLNPLRVVAEWTGRYAGMGGPSYDLRVYDGDIALCRVSINANSINVYGSTMERSGSSKFELCRQFELADPNFDPEHPEHFEAFIHMVIQAEQRYNDKLQELADLEQSLRRSLAV